MEYIYEEVSEEDWNKKMVKIKNELKNEMKINLWFEKGICCYFYHGKKYYLRRVDE